MSAPVTLPGDIPGLLRRGAPVIIGGAQVLMTGAYKQGQSLRACFDQYASTLPLQEMEPEAFEIAELDLSEPAGRDIAVRWIAEKLGVETGLTAPMLYMNERGVWILTCNWEPLRRWFFHPDPDYGCGNTNWSAVPRLPNDRTQGIEALRIIVLHLAGRQS